MNNWLKRQVVRCLVRPRTVPVSACVHFCGFRYGVGGCNPYEEYARALVQGGNLPAARQGFVDFLRHYRPRDLGEALGVTLGRAYPLWQLPWDDPPPGGTAAPGAWVEEPDDAPDIMTHFSARGIPYFRIEEEFLWAEQLHHSIQRHGYDPRRAESPIQACALQAADGDTRYLLLDGNHRVAALGARGAATTVVRCVRLAPVRVTGLAAWPRVRDGTYAAADAERVFRAYFDGNARPRTTEQAAGILGAEGGRA